MTQPVTVMNEHLPFSRVLIILSSNIATHVKHLEVSFFDTMKTKYSGLGHYTVQCKINYERKCKCIM